MPVAVRLSASDWFARTSLSAMTPSKSMMIAAGVTPPSPTSPDCAAGRRRCPWPPRHDRRAVAPAPHRRAGRSTGGRSEEHTSELQSLMRISYAVFCLKKKINKHDLQTNETQNIVHNQTDKT